MRTIIRALLLTVMSLTTFAADSNKTHKVLFEFTSPGKEPSTAVLNNIENVRKTLGAGTQVILVAHGPGIALLQKAGNDSVEQLCKLSDSGVVLAACENTMKRKNLTKADLVDFSTTVDSGVAEVVRRQEAGWSYVKSGH